MDYDDLLNQTWEDVPVEKLLPGGNWALVGRNAALIKPKKEGDSLKVLFSYTATQPIDVAEDLLEELGADYDISTNDLTFTQYVEKPSDWNKVKEHLEKHGVEMTGAILDGNGKLAFNKAFRGAQVVAAIGQRNYESADGEVIWQNQLSKFQKVAE